MVSAYIDLNPVRAGIVKDPKDYRFCNYSEALAGNKEALTGLLSVMNTVKIENALSRYRLYLYERGYFSSHATEGKKSITTEEYEKVNKRNGEMSIRDQLLHRSRYFTDGMIFGSRLFVDTIFDNHRTLFSVNRKTGARPTRGFEFDLFVGRAVQ
jgi:hypothetical protein